MGSMLKLYEEVDAYQIVLDWIEEHAEEISNAGGELPPELVELLDSVGGSVEEKVERTVLVIRNLKRNADAAAAEAKHLAAIAATHQRQADSLKDYLALQMERAGMQKFSGAKAKAWFQKNGRPSIRPKNPDAIPKKYQRVIVEFDGQKAYEDFKAADLIPDPEDGAVEIDGLVIERGKHLQIR